MAIRIAYNDRGTPRPFGFTMFDGDSKDLYIVMIKGDEANFVTLEGEFQSNCTDSGNTVEEIFDMVHSGTWMIVPKDFKFGTFKYQFMYYDVHTDRYVISENFYTDMDDFVESCLGFVPHNPKRVEESKKYVA